jgi:hyperosmotically inducible protein
MLLTARYTLALSLLGAALCTGCAPANNAAAGAKSLMNEVGDRATDVSISVAVKTSLIDDPLVKSKQLEVSTREGVVTLAGTQPTWEGKQRALELAHRARGVKGVVDEIVLPDGVVAPVKAVPPPPPPPPPPPADTPGSPVAPPPGVWQ